MVFILNIMYGGTYTMMMIHIYMVVHMVDMVHIVVHIADDDDAADADDDDDDEAETWFWLICSAIPFSGRSRSAPRLKVTRLPSCCS